MSNINIMLRLPSRFAQCFIWLVLLLLAGCASVPPRPQNANNACSIFSQYPSWYKHAKKAEQRWGVKVATQLAFIHQESSFVGNAKPARKAVLFIIPGGRPSSSYGYAQALDSTWRDYQRDTGNYSAKRDDFEDSADFVGWFIRRIHLQTGIPYTNVYALYLAYHEGGKGYLLGTYRHKVWLINVAKRVQYRAQMYQNQLKYCANRFL